MKKKKRKKNQKKQRAIRQNKRKQKKKKIKKNSKTFNPKNDYFDFNEDNFFYYPNEKKESNEYIDNELTGKILDLLLKKEIDKIMYEDPFLFAEEDDLDFIPDLDFDPYIDMDDDLFFQDEFFYEPVSPSLTAEDYLKDMKKYADFSNNKVPAVEYDSDYITYSFMNQKQLDYYFYWRKEARRGQFIPASSTYYLLYFYELLNLVGTPSPEEALKQLNKLYLLFHDKRIDFSITESGLKLLAGNIFDFLYFHDLNVNELEPIIWKYIENDDRLILGLELFDNSDNLIIPFELLNQISRFYIESKSEIFRNNEDIYKEALINTFYLIDYFSRKEKNISYIKSNYYKSNYSRNLYFQTFENVIIDSSVIDLNKPIKTRMNRNNLYDSVSGIFQEVENVFRDFYGFRGRLRKYSIDDWTKNIIDSFLESQYSPESKARYTGSIQPAINYLESIFKENKIEIDISRLEKLRSETEIVQELMDTSDLEDDLSLSKSSNELEFVDSLAQMLSNLVKKDSTIINSISNILQDDSKIIKNDFIKESKEIINNEAKRFLNQPLLLESNNTLQLNDLYYLSLKNIFDNIKNYPFLEIHKNEVNSTNEELKNFLDDLNKTEFEFLRILIKSKNPEQELNNLAQEQMTMVELLFDDINNKALLYLDDILLEMNINNIPEISEEYYEDIRSFIEMETKE